MNLPHSANSKSPAKGVLNQPAEIEALVLVEPETGWRRIGTGKRLALFIAIVFVAAGLGGIVPPGEWYEALDKPPWTPPNWLFAPAWAVLYLMIAVAGWIIFTHATSVISKVLWAVQIVLNAAWSLLFFAAQEIGLALIDGIAMSVLSLTLIVVLFRQVFAWSRLAAMLFIPYWLWVTFAAVLTASIWLRLPAGT